MKSKYPYQDVTSAILPNERWESVVDYEDYYEVSNLGRIRSIDRTIPHPRWGFQFVKGRILKQKVQVNKNTISDKLMVDLQVSLSKDGKQHYRNVRRLVYSSFVKPLDYKKDKLYVINKNCDGFDNQLENLKCVTIQEKSHRAFDRGRVPESILGSADRTNWPDYGSLARSKPVVQLDMDGKVVARYPSIREASRRTNVGEKEIIGVAKGRYKRWNGYYWKYEGSPEKK